MDPARRLAYLEAMGIDVWRLRSAETQPHPRPARTAPAAGGPAVATAQASAAPAPTPPPRASQPAPPPARPQADTPATPATPAGAAPAPSQLPTDEEPPPWTDGELSGAPPGDDVGVSPTEHLDTTPDRAQADAVAAMDWAALEQAVAGCHACRLCECRTRTVFGVGDRHASVMFIGEGPGADEDRQGEPFVGRAGQLLNRMLAAAGFKREQVYIANIVKCRPPNNRDPSADEAAACRAYLERQIALVQPRLIVCLGRVPTSNLLDTTESVSRLRGQLHRHAPTQTPVLVTYHPSYYLRSPEQKAKGWQDLQQMLEFLAAETAAVS